MGNSSLYKARNAKEDEFYTQLRDVEQEMVHYRNHFEGKTIFLNCDDPSHSSFWEYFEMNFDFLGLKGLIATHYVYDVEKDGPAYMLRYDTQKNTNKEKVTKKYLSGDGDFRSQEALELLKEADIVITNPPFSLFREFIALLIDYKKNFIVLGSQNAFTYNDIFPLIKNNKLWTGYKNGDMAFMVPDYYPPRETRYWVDESGQKWRSMGNICWFTNLEHDKRNEDLVLTEFYEGNESRYPKYDGSDIINTDKVKDIPMDYTGLIGVPITFLNSYNPNQFELIALSNSARAIDSEVLTVIGDRKVYNRFFIRNKKPVSKKEILGF